MSILTTCSFPRAAFTNRIQLKFPDGRRWLTVPLAGKGSFQTIADLRAADGDWRLRHRQMLQDSLGDAPFLADALAIMDAAYAHEQLCDLLIASIDLPAAYLGLKPAKRVRSHELGIAGQSWQRVRRHGRAGGRHPLRHRARRRALS